jgi:hypothetical protein
MVIYDGFVKRLSAGAGREINVGEDVVGGGPGSTGCRQSSRTTGIEPCNIC